MDALESSGLTPEQVAALRAEFGLSTPDRPAEVSAEPEPVELPPHGGERPPILRVGDELICRTSQGELRIPVRLTTRLLRGMLAAGDDEIAQLELMLESLSSDPATAAKVDELDPIDETFPILAAWGEALSEKVGAHRLGESQASSS